MMIHSTHIATIACFCLLNSMISNVRALTAKQRGEADETETQEPTAAAAVGELAKKTDALSRSSILEGHGIGTPPTQTRLEQAMGSPQERLARAGDRLSELSALVTKLEIAVRQDQSACLI